jgi:hypothetical protein
MLDYFIAHSQRLEAKRPLDGCSKCPGKVSNTLGIRIVVLLPCIRPSPGPGKHTVPTHSMILKITVSNQRCGPLDPNYF